MTKKDKRQKDRKRFKAKNKDLEREKIGAKVRALNRKKDTKQDKFQQKLCYQKDKRQQE